MQKNFISAVFFLALSLFSLLPEAANACKSRFYPPSFPVDEIKEYNHVYVVHVDKVNLNTPLEESWYAPPFSFEGRIIKTLKGSKKPGDAIQGMTNSDKEAQARCPIFLESGKVYLLMMVGDEMPYLLPRYGSLFVPSDHPKFQRYVAEIRRLNKKKHKLK
jgi:hypothetical protein